MTCEVPVVQRKFKYGGRELECSPVREIETINRILLSKRNDTDPPPPIQTGWISQGCYTDSVAARSLFVNMGIGSSVTTAKCQDACHNAGYSFAGVEYAGECYCDNQVRNGGGPAPDGDVGCNMPCSGNATEMCGGPDRLNLFRYITGNEPSSTAGAGPTNTESIPTQSSSEAPIPTDIPDGWKYKGCWVDGLGYRIMGFQQPDSNSMTIASCSQKCASLNYTIAGMEYSSQCFCDNVIRMNGSLASVDSQCSMSCSGASSQTCGGPDRLSIWSTQDTLKVLQKPKVYEEVGDWKYQGCISDPQGVPAWDRAFPWQLVNKTGNSPQWCLGMCAQYGYMAAGMEYGEECYCGDLRDVQNMTESDCNMPCPGDPEAFCGGGNRLTWYKYEGDPLYIFKYPEGAEAGLYKFLVGGPVIPLISQPQINGKVMFVEKLNTGPGNSTGSYEFDPSLADNIFTTFRELQGIKTDVFCAAGLTLPDKKARLITVGGWSLDSTFGIRLYTPDGVLGTNGTSKWQENEKILKLQAGRWYPTAMTMSNGSILVVGGEDGSNGNPVPSLEILPPTGPIVNLEFLERTDPYNLYPYLVVLPSKGIFIQYYNEALILDERTFDTIKVLPNVPASVNDPEGGRTYPYEGTQVLLPQYAPYTDPLEVLICGGAAQQPAWGLDNCVSIIPDADEPEWTIERMPSRRVISCMVTLPDGTFLIMNGGETGEAGFKLGKNPNLNALLYDSRLPKHRRISVMANTTIPRMYHSEAVLLDDGRVLVSGSDPQDPGFFDQEYRLEVFIPPYLLSGLPQPSFKIANQTDWDNDHSYTVIVTSSLSPPSQGKFSLLGSEASTHGNSMGARILFPAFSCAGSVCQITAPPGPYICPPGWYRLYFLDGGKTPSWGKWVRIGGDPAGLGNWPDEPDFQPLPGV